MPHETQLKNYFKCRSCNIADMSYGKKISHYLKSHKAWHRELAKNTSTAEKKYRYKV